MVNEKLFFQHTSPMDLSANYRTGLYGDHDCDSPAMLVDDVMQHIKHEFHDIDLVFWTGDSARYDIGPAVMM
jgi:hypothetical protein